MNMLGQILSKFRSFAIIATHSPLIVREMVCKNVYLMKTMQGNIPIVSKVVFETFGADTSELYSRIFQYDERSSLFYNYVRTLTKKKIFSFEDALDHVREFAPNLSLNARLSIRDYIDE
jgi:predicted ATP-binding protein involved in virulence